MKLNLCILLLLGHVISAYSHEPNPRWSLGIFISPDYCYRDLKYSGDDNAFINLTASRNESEKPKLGFTTGLIGRYNINKKYGIELGLTYSDKGFKYERLPLYHFNSSDTAVGYSNFRYHFRYYEMPIKATYTIEVAKRIKLRAGAGAFVNFYSNTKAVSEIHKFDGNTYMEKTRSRDHYIENFNYGVCGSLAFDFYRSQQFDLRLEPNFRYSLRSMAISEMRTRLYSIGVGIGFIYKVQ